MSEKQDQMVHITQYSFSLEKVATFAAYCPLFTIIICYIFAQWLNHAPLLVCPISFTGFLAPEKYIYSIGFTVSGIAFLFALIIITQKLQSKATSQNSEKKKKLVKLFFITGVICIVAFVVHAIIPLQEDAGQQVKGALLGLSPKTMTYLNWESIVHQSSAGIFFLFGLCNAICMLLMYREGLLKVSRNVFFAKCFCVFCMIAGPAAMILHPVSVNFGFEGLSPRGKLIAGAISQYVIVGGLLGMVGLYSYDLEKWKFVYRIEDDAINKM